MKKLLFVLFALISTNLIGQVEFEFESVTKLSETVNSEYEESFPLFDATNNRLYFVRTLHPSNKGGKTVGQDLWYSDLNGNSWSTSSNELKPLNNYLNNSAIGISQDGNRLYLVGTYIKKISLQSGFSESLKEGDSWSRPIPLTIPSFNLKSPFYGGYVPPSEDIIVISMEGSNSKGKEDLYVSLKDNNGGWSTPVWLGDSINSEGFEISPFLFDDGKTLMFASNGLGGLGDCDIFYSHRKDSSWTNWTTPKNAGAPINSAGFDAFPFAAQETMYFSSNRNDSLSDIYSALYKMVFLDADIIRLVFESGESRMSNVEVDVLDEMGQLVGTYRTGKYDIVEIPGLKEKKEYTLVPSHPIVDLKMFHPMLLNKDGAYIEELAMGEDDSMFIAPQTEETVAKQQPIPKPAFVASMQGIFEADRTALSGILLALEDENGKIYQYARTTKEGRFAFAETNANSVLGIRVISELEYIKDNGVIYYTDPQGKKLFKGAVGENGAFKYQKIQARELSQLKMLVDVDTKMAASPASSKGVFKFKNLPQEGVKLLLYDENNNVIEEVITDKDGQFAFKKLRPDQDFNIKPADDALGKGSLAFLDRNGNEMSIAESDDFGFKYKALNPEIMNGLQRMIEEDSDASLGQNFVFSIGLFKYKSIATEGVTLSLLDGNDKIIETVTTDQYGHFVFSMLKPDQNYKVQVLGLDDSNLDESQLYFVDKNGHVTTGILRQNQLYFFSKLKPDYFFNIADVNTGETGLLITESFKDVKGTFKYEGLAKEGVKLELLDENNKVIETIYTDENGNFIFSKLAKESSYIVRLSDGERSMIDQSSFQFINENDEYLEQAGMTETGFQFKTLPRSEESMSGKLASDNTSLNARSFLPKDKASSSTSKKPMITSKSTSGSSANPMEDKNDLKLKTIFFNFNSIRLSNNDCYNLTHKVYQKASRSGQPILILGYSCDLGSPAVNNAISKMRAEEVKKYLVNLGIDPDRIETEVITSEEAEKMTYGERLENRKVEVYHLTP